jgi:hypothetical protein
MGGHFQGPPEFVEGDSGAALNLRIVLHQAHEGSTLTFRTVVDPPVRSLSTPDDAAFRIPRLYGMACLDSGMDSQPRNPRLLNSTFGIEEVCRQTQKFRLISDDLFILRGDVGQ